MIPNSVKHRFWSKVDKRGENECWLWIAGTDSDGYGKFRYNGSAIHASRMALMIKLDRELYDNALHTCDNRICCNYDHLYEGTTQQNRWDQAYRQRDNPKVSKGSLNSEAKFTNEEIRSIRSRSFAGEHPNNIAIDLMVGVTTIRRIIRRETYVDVL